MKLFVFKIHEDTSYIDGMILIVAESYERAHKLYIARGQREGKYNHFRNPILRYRPDKLDYVHGNPWYLAHTLDLKDDTVQEGILSVAYHDG